MPGLLREVTEADVPFFFAYQLDSVANHMCGFGVEDPTDRAAYGARWAGHLANDAIVKRTIVADGVVAGHVLCFDRAGKREVGYWLGREHWGKGLATRALTEFLREVVTTRPLVARVVADNKGSLRVLEKCGFEVYGSDRSYGHARGGLVDEVLLELR